MKYSISYSSMTGNTRSLAEYMQVALPSEGRVFFGKNVDVTDEIIESAETMLIGFWTYKGSCDDEAAALVKRVRGKRLALFGTAGFGGSAQYFKRIISQIAPLIDKSCTMIEPFVCMGKMTQEVLMRYTDELKKDPENERLLRLVENYKSAMAHPDSNDFSNLLAWAKPAIGIS